MSGLIQSKSKEHLCALLDRPSELKDLIERNNVNLSVDKNTLYATREEMHDSVWFSRITYNMPHQDIADFKSLIGWVGEQKDYVRKPEMTRVFSYNDILEFKKNKLV